MQSTTRPPQLMGQLFHLFEAPNRFGLPAFYTLHVWAWKENPTGTFVELALQTCRATGLTGSNRGTVPFTLLCSRFRFVFRFGVRWVRAG